MTTHNQQQRGVAAIEFAIVFVVLFAALYAIVNWGGALYIHQVVARAAEDGARAAAMVPIESAASGAATQAVRKSLMASLVVPLEHAASTSDRLAWIIKNIEVTALKENGALTVSVSYPYAAHPILPSTSLIKDLMPKTLRSSATTALPLDWQNS